MDPGDEPVEVVDDDGRALRVVPRHVIREELLLHRCTYVLVLNPGGELYVHRRTATKDTYPSFYDVCAGGICAVGESFDDCAAREVEEELGVGARPTFRFLHRYDGPDGRVIGAVYDVVWDGPIRHQAAEVEWGAFEPVDAIEDRIARDAFCPDGLEVYRRWLADREWRGPG
jgi:8-oxo-dGTP pyrophosphatase MutT (NUDIX family)